MEDSNRPEILCICGQLFSFWTVPKKIFIAIVYIIFQGYTAGKMR
jgi:hypothetical protein